jgi:hypothetical protein
VTFVARPARVLRDEGGLATGGASGCPRLATLAASSRPMEIAAIGYGGLVLIWLMVMKPF